jgi:hypothetical protein
MTIIFRTLVRRLRFPGCGAHSMHTNSVPQDRRLNRTHSFGRSATDTANQCQGCQGSGLAPFFYDAPGLLLINDRSYRKCAGENASGAGGCSGRRTFDKTVSSKPLAFAADAAPMGIQWRFGTRVRVGVRIFGGWIGHFGGVIAGDERRYVEDFGVSLVMRSGEASTDTRLA